MNDKVVENIRACGTFRDSGQKRLRVLSDIGFRMDEKADYVLLGGCQLPESMPQVFKAAKNLLDLLQVDYTMLVKEYCCGWVPFGQPAVMAKDESAITQAKTLSREFILNNFRQAEALGAKSIALFCAACEPNYINYRQATKLELVSFPEVIDRHLKRGTLEAEVDYYAGCYRFRRRITTEPLDIGPARRILEKIAGLKVNYVDNSLCCFIPSHLERLTRSLITKNVVTICSGCYINLKKTLTDDYRVMMLPELVLKAVQS